METSDQAAVPPAAAAAMQEEEEEESMAGNRAVDNDGGTASSSMQQEQQESGHGRSLPFMLHVGGALILTWIASAFSINSIFVVVIIFIYLYQVEKQVRTREHRWIRHEERRKAHMTRLDDGETVRWLNQAIVSIWPVCLESFASQQFLMPLVPWFLAKYKPRFVKEVLLQKLHLGNRAPVFTLIRALDQQREGDQLIIEAAMEFASGEDMSAEMSVALRRRYGGFRTTFYISKLHIEGKVKVAVKFVNGWPVLGRIRFCFAQLPYVQMTACPLYRGGIDVTYIPGAARWLEATIVTALEQSLVEPNLLVVDMEKIANNAMFSNMTSEQRTAFAQDDKAPATAILHLDILDAKQLRTTDKNDPFVTIALGSSSKKTTVKKKSANPTWNEKFHLPIYNWDHPNILKMRVHDSWCTVRVSDYRHGELREETFPLEMQVKKQMKKVGQLHFAILVENIALFEDNQSNLAASEQLGTRELYMDGNTVSTEFSTVSSDAFVKRLKPELPPAANNAHVDQRQTKDKSSHSRTSSAGGPETTQSLVPEVQPPLHEGEVSEIIDVAIGPPGAFMILHPGKASPKNWPTTQKLGNKSSNLPEKVKNEREGVRKSGILQIFHRRKRSGGGSQESLTAMEKEGDPSVAGSVEDSGELLPPSLPKNNGPVKLILEPGAIATSSIAPDEEPPPAPLPFKMFVHPQTLTPILSSQKHTDPDDEDDQTRTLDLTPNGTDFMVQDDPDNNSELLQNGLPSAQRKKGGWLGKVTHIGWKKQKSSQLLDHDEDQVMYSQELYSDGDRESNYNPTFAIDKDELPIHEDEKKIINSAKSQRGSSLRNISQRTWAKLGLGPKKPL
ncbi:unnamed protein product [Sphagnum compactum]